ncbi:hypothetical protein K435DRAFT_624523, partial [Dendrothele bispora CBS 962.96]
MLHRGGRGNDGERTIDETRSGELAVECIACPRPEVNLPIDWQNAPDNIKFIYMMFMAIDACFRLKRKRISSWNHDPSLQDGWAYFVENKPFLEWIESTKGQKEISTCTGLAALDHANTKFHDGYDETGKVAGLCARHEILLKNGMGATQVGERYVNVDFVVASILQHLSMLLMLLISYDIVCQWSKKLPQRLKKLPPFPRLHLILKASIERLWSGLGSVSNSIKEMGPGSHHDILEDHISYWNWNKVIGMGAILKRRLIAAVEEYQKQFESWMEFTQSQNQHAVTWKAMVDEYESGASEFNPYASPEMKAEERQINENADDEEYEDDHDLPDLETSPGEFLYYALEIEQQQRELREDILTVRTPTNKQMTAMLDRRTKLTRQLRRFRALQLAYMPVALQIIATLPPSKTEVNAKDLPLYLPSMLDPEQRSSDLCKACLPEMEIRLRDGQLTESLNHLRQALLVKQRLLRYKKTNARNQGATTRSRAMINRQEKKVKLAAKTYQEAWKAKLALVGGDRSRVGWKELLQEHIICMEDLQDAEKK